MTPDWSSAAEAVAAVLIARALPTTVFILVVPSSSRWVRTSALAVLGLAWVLAVQINVDACELALGYGYFVLATAGTYLLGLPRFQRGRLTSGALMTFLLVAFLLLPATLLRHHMASAVFLGWEFALAIYSYMTEAKAGTLEPSLSDCTFFVLVDPTLCVRDRSRRVGRPTFCWESARHVGYGVAMMFLGLLSGQVAGTSSVLGLPSASGVSVGLLEFVRIYFTFAGLASALIGFAKLAGYRAPPRYQRPWLARSPADFWRRWNTYMYGWLRRYVFVPSLRSRKTAAFDSRGSRAVLAVLVTFVISGMLHDAFAFVDSFQPSFRTTMFFVVAGVQVVVWSAISRSGAFSPLSHLGFGRAALGVGARLLVFMQVLWGAAIWSRGVPL